jgi:hypothetical protein
MLFASVFVAFAVAAAFVQDASDLHTLAHDVTRMESIRNIKNIQRQISHLAQFGEWQRISELFSSNSNLIWGNFTTHGPLSIESWLRSDSSFMDGVHPGSLYTLIAETPVISLSTDGHTAKGR